MPDRLIKSSQGSFAAFHSPKRSSFNASAHGGFQLQPEEGRWVVHLLADSDQVDGELKALT